MKKPTHAKFKRAVGSGIMRGEVVFISKQSAVCMIKGKKNIGALDF